MKRKAEYVFEYTRPGVYPTGVIKIYAYHDDIAFREARKKLCFHGFRGYHPEPRIWKAKSHPFSLKLLEVNP